MKLPGAALFLCLSLAGLALLFSAGCSSVVERGQSMVALKAIPVKGARDRELRITGSSGGSALSIASIVEKRDGGEINVLVTQRLVGCHGAKAGQSGSFDYTVKIPDGVNVVTFGKNKAVLWCHAGR